jgi:putative RecB family exonuclease
MSVDAPPLATGETCPAGSPAPRSRSLSPSRASDFMSCPLRYRFRVVDRLVEPPSPAAARGTLVHAVLDRLFELPPAERTVRAAERLLEPAWAQLLEDEPDLAALFPDPAADRVPMTSGPDRSEPGTGTGAPPSLEDWFAGARRLLAAYFALEDPVRLAPAGRELLVEHELGSGLVLRGVIDRLDEAPGDLLRVVDYKTGSAPGEAFEGRALFQLKFYALVLWRTRGIVPAELTLLYLGERSERLRYRPDAAELAAFERTLLALSDAIERAHASGDWRARPSALCRWCDHQVRCPAFGGTPPPLPATAILDEPPPERVDVLG